MKKLGFLLLLLSVGMFSYGCTKPEEKPAADAAPAVESDDAGAAADAPADAAPAAEGEKKE